MNLEGFIYTHVRFNYDRGLEFYVPLPINISFIPRSMDIDEPTSRVSLIYRLEKIVNTETDLKLYHYSFQGVMIK